jgi:hypothetical protein
VFHMLCYFWFKKNLLLLNKFEMLQKGTKVRDLSVLELELLLNSKMLWCSPQ